MVEIASTETGRTIEQLAEAAIANETIQFKVSRPAPMKDSRNE